MRNILHKLLTAKFVLLGLIISVYVPYVLAETPTTHIGRYLTVENRPNVAQTDLLSQTIQ